MDNDRFETTPRNVFKKRILVQDVGGAGFQTGGIRRYVEDLNPGPNTQIGPKDFLGQLLPNGDLDIAILPGTMIQRL